MEHTLTTNHLTEKKSEAGHILKTGLGWVRRAPQGGRKRGAMRATERNIPVTGHKLKTALGSRRGE